MIVIVSLLGVGCFNPPARCFTARDAVRVGCTARRWMPLRMGSGVILDFKEELVPLVGALDNEGLQGDFVRYRPGEAEGGVSAGECGPC
jgi:hypothetical protein